jgi:hypothetical protein
MEAYARTCFFKRPRRGAKPPLDVGSRSCGGATVDWAAASYDLHEVPIPTQRVIVSQQNHRFNPCLRH